MDYAVWLEKTKFQSEVNELFCDLLAFQEVRVILQLQNFPCPPMGWDIWVQIILITLVCWVIFTIIIFFLQLKIFKTTVLASNKG